MLCAAEKTFVGQHGLLYWILPERRALPATRNAGLLLISAYTLHMSQSKSLESA